MKLYPGITTQQSILDSQKFYVVSSNKRKWLGTLQQNKDNDWFVSAPVEMFCTTRLTATMEEAANLLFDELIIKNL